MKKETRSKNSTRNILFSILSYMVQIVLGFLARRYFIYYFSTEYLGLNSLFSNVISILSLAELGFGSALVFAMYKPMAHDDDEKVRQLLSYYKNCYLIIGVVVATLGLCVLPFMGFFKAKAPNVDVNLYAVYLLLLFNTVVSYFFAHRRSLLYTSQRNDIESKITILIKILLNATQLLIIIFTKNYYLYVATTWFFTICDNVLVYFITQKIFPELVKKPLSKLDDQTKKAIRKNVFALLFHKIGGVVVFGTDSLLIYLLFDASTLGVYSNYLLVVNQVGTFIGIFTKAIKGSIGNSIAKESPEFNANLLKKLNFAYFAIVSFCTICIFALVDPFISVALTKDANTNLLLDTTSKVLICVSFYLTQSRSMVATFRDCKGLFYESRFSPIFEATINLVASFVLAKFIGLGGIILGTIISTIAVPLWVEPFILNKYYLKQSTLKYFARYAMYTCCMLLSGVVVFALSSVIPHTSIFMLVIKFVACATVAGIMIVATMRPFKEFNQCKTLLKNAISNLKHK